MDLTVAAPGRPARINPSGRFDAHQAPEVAGWITAQLDAGASELEVDLSGVGFIDSAALAVLVGGMKRCRSAGGDLVLIAPSEPVSVILELTRLDRALTIRRRAGGLALAPTA